VAKRVGSKLELFIPITKVDEENRLVYGTIAAEEIDNSGEIFDYESSKPNFEKWSDDQYEASDGKSKGNVRAMHTSKAAGKLTDISYNDDTKTIEGVAKIVDGDEWEKVLEGVYTGFSMGGRYAKRWNDNGTTRYTAQPVEVSIVDKPCIKSALFDGMKKTFMLQKADGTIEERPFVNKGDDMFVPTNDQILPVAQPSPRRRVRPKPIGWSSPMRLAISWLRNTHRSRRPLRRSTPTRIARPGTTAPSAPTWRLPRPLAPIRGSRGSRRRRVSLMKGTTLGRVIRNSPPTLNRS
jgi:hypothetical protein